MNIEVLQKYNKKYKGKYPFLEELNNEWAISKPLEGYRILHNIPLTNETLLKLESLFLAGAEVTVTHLNLQGLDPKQECVDLLNAAGVDVEVNHDKLSGVFDFGLDCCAQIPDMKNVVITKGYVELTQSGTEVYKKLDLDVPVISVDDSKLKCLEGMYGTGEACVRAIKEFVSADIKNKKVVVFGYGKVGRGIVKYLSKETSNITIIEPNPIYLEEIKLLGFEFIVPEATQEIIDAVNDSFAVITATGKNGVVSKICSENDINSGVHLLNMGAEDEYGEKFSSERIFANRAPMNFLLDAPTLIHYIDPIFYVHNKVCLDLLNNLNSGYSSLPSELDIPLINKWSKIHNINCEDVFAL